MHTPWSRLHEKQARVKGLDFGAGTAWGVTFASYAAQRLLPQWNMASGPTPCEAAPGAIPAALRKEDELTLHIADSVGSLSQREAVFADPEDTLRSVAHKLWAESVGVLVVGDKRHVLGVISERDIAAELAQGADPDVKTAREAMTGYVIFARPDDPLYDVAGQMLDDAVRHVPVVGADGQVVGMVSVRDLLQPLLLDALSSPPSRV